MSRAAIVHPQSPSILTVGIVCYQNSDQQLQRLLASIEIACAGIAAEVQVAITGNDHKARRFARRKVPVAYRIAKNTGFGYAHNRMMAAAFAGGTTHYLCINPDGLLHHAALRHLLAADERYASQALVEAAQLPIQHPKDFDPLTLDTPWASGACFLYPRQVYEKVGGFDEAFFMYCEDVDLSWRVRQHGFSIKFEPRAFFYHDAFDRAPNRARQRQLLLSARMLAYKHGYPGYAKWVEETLLGSGMVRDRGNLPRITQSAERPLDPTIADFDHGLIFAPARW
ncbi:glycosyltransferase family 2 protein [Rhodocyclaceae bacterium]